MAPVDEKNNMFCLKIINRYSYDPWWRHSDIHFRNNLLLYRITLNYE